MGIIKRIKEFFRRIRIKKLNIPQENSINTIQDSENTPDKLEYIKNINKPELTYTQKIEEILKTVGCDEKSIEEILEIENIDIENLRKNLYTLNSFNYTNIELTIIITNNKQLINMKNQELLEIINSLKSYFKEEKIVKELIYSNSKILNTEIIKKLNSTKEIFKKFGLEIMENQYILIENSNILIMENRKLENSLGLIKQNTKTFESFINLIKTEPIVIGINNANLLTQYM